MNSKTNRRIRYLYILLLFLLERNSIFGETNIVAVRSKRYSRHFVGLNFKRKQSVSIREDLQTRERLRRTTTNENSVESNSVKARLTVDRAAPCFSLSAPDIYCVPAAIIYRCALPLKAIADLSIIYRVITPPLPPSAHHLHSNRFRIYAHRQIIERANAFVNSLYYSSWTQPSFHHRDRSRNCGRIKLCNWINHVSYRPLTS